MTTALYVHPRLDAELERLEVERLEAFLAACAACELLIAEYVKHNGHPDRLVCRAYGVRLDIAYSEGLDRFVIVACELDPGEPPPAPHTAPRPGQSPQRAEDLVSMQWLDDGALRIGHGEEAARRTPDLISEESLLAEDFAIESAPANLGGPHNSAARSETSSLIGALQRARLSTIEKEMAIRAVFSLLSPAAASIVMAGLTVRAFANDLRKTSDDR
jgi:hypothetical protein